MALTKKADFAFKYTAQIDEPVFATTADLKTALDSQAVELKDYNNNVLTAELEASTASASLGAVVGGVPSKIQTFIDNVEAAGSGTTPGNDVITNAMMGTDVKIGSLAALTTSIKTSIQAAINWIVSIIGTLSGLTTTEKGTIVGAINEVNAKTASDLTTQGDILVRGAVVNQRLGIGSPYQSLNVNSAGTQPQYQSSLQSLITAAGDLIYGSAANTPARLAFDSTANKALISNGATLVYGYPKNVKYQSSNNIIVSANTERFLSYPGGFGFQIVKQFEAANAGTVTIILELKSTNSQYAAAVITSSARQQLVSPLSTYSPTYTTLQFNNVPVPADKILNVEFGINVSGVVYIRNVTMRADIVPIESIVTLD